jgi:general secretion pathway protein J
VTQAGEDAGFTLLEILVALVVFGLLLAGLTQGVHLGLTAWGQQTRRVNASSELDATDRTLRQLLGEIEPGRPSEPPNIDGRQDRLVFTSILPLALQNEVDRRSDMVLMVDGAHRLLLRWAPHLHVRRLVPPPTPAEAVLLDHVERLELSYWQDGVWRSSWQAREPPQLVRMRLLFPPGDARRWPDMVVAPMRHGFPG